MRLDVSTSVWWERNQLSRMQIAADISAHTSQIFIWETTARASDWPSALTAALHKGYAALLLKVFGFCLIITLKMIVFHLASVFSFVAMVISWVICGEELFYIQVSYCCCWELCLHILSFKCFSWINTAGHPLCLWVLQKFDQTSLWLNLVTPWRPQSVRKTFILNKVPHTTEMPDFFWGK